MPHIERVLSCQFTHLKERIISFVVGIVLQTGILEAGQGPFSLELLLRTAELPQEWQVVAEVAYQLRVILEIQDW